MDDYALTRSYLETLSTDDLSVLGERLGLDLSPDMGRAAVVEEILEAFHEDDIPLPQTMDGVSDGDPEFEPNDDSSAVPVARLPDSYSATYVEVLLRDPIWAFVFWEIRTSDRDLYERGVSFSGYRLKVSSIPEGDSVSSDSFYVDIQKDDAARYICYPYSAGWFKVELCVQKDSGEIVLASSPTIRIPNGRTAASLESHPSYPALELSGLSEMRLARNIDRASRVMNRCEF